MKKLFLNSALVFYLLMPSCITTHISKQTNPSIVKPTYSPRIQNVIPDGLYDNHNAFVDESKFSLDKIIESVESVVYDVSYSISYETLNGEVYSTVQNKRGTGTGVVIEKRDGKAYILTNDHVTKKGNIDFRISKPFKWLKVEGIAEKIYIKKGKSKLKAKKVDSDSDLDMALLEVKDSQDFKKFPYKIGNSDDLGTGDFIWVIGNPLDFIKYTLKGNVSKLATDHNPDRFMVGCYIEKGHSGSVAVAIRDGCYELVGLVVGTLERSTEDQETNSATIPGYGEVIKINRIKDFFNNYFDKKKL